MNRLNRFINEVLEHEIRDELRMAAMKQSQETEKQRKGLVKINMDPKRRYDMV